MLNTEEIEFVYVLLLRKTVKYSYNAFQTTISSTGFAHCLVLTHFVLVECSFLDVLALKLWLMMLREFRYHHLQLDSDTH